MDSPPPWKGSQAKKLLYDDLVEGDVDDTMEPKEVFMMRAEYSLYPYNNFVTNLRNLRASIRKKREGASNSEIALRNDLSLGMIARRKPYWPDSAASRLLIDDINLGVVETMSKKDLWLSREEYQAFPYTCFADHVRQHIRLTKERSYWSFVNSNKH